MCIRERECFGVPKGGGDVPKSSGDAPERRRRGSTEGLASADILRDGNPLRKELERGPEVEKWDTHCHQV